MKVTPAAAAVPLLLLLLTWLSLQAFNPGAELIDRVLGTLDNFAMVENALHRDVLMARNGLLRNYDPLVREINRLHAGVDRLREAAVLDPEIAKAIDELAASVSQQDELTEKFKSDSALLQNSLSYFSFFSTRLGPSERDGPVAAAVSALAAAMLSFTLDTSAITAHEVENRLDELAKQSPPTGDARSIEALLAHGRLLHDLLPETDNLVKTLFAVPNASEQKAIRALVLKHQIAARETARRSRLLLYATSVLLLGILVYLGLCLRAGTLALQRRAAFEHVVARISTRFINAQPHEIDSYFKQALGELADLLGSDRAYFVIAGPPVRVHAWSRHGITYPLNWPAQALELVSRFRPTTEGIVHVGSVNSLPHGPDRNALATAGMSCWASVSHVDEDRVSVVLGFDTLQPWRQKEHRELSILRLALDAFANAAGREVLEGERTRLETKLQHARRMETVGAFASGIAHNFNNIIAAILGHLEMADEYIASDSRPARNIEAIRRAAERASELVDQILAFGRCRDTRRRPVSVQALISESAALLRPSLPLGIEFVMHDIPQAAVVAGEGAQLQQVILNLCNNAAQAMVQGGYIEIDVEIQEIASTKSLTHGELATGRYARIAVSDVGQGIDETSLDRIFEPFFTTRLAGNGLGLATVREIIREHAGAMNVWSKPGVGTRFEVWLPCIASKETTPKEDNQIIAQLGRGETLLVVECDRKHLLTNEDMLAALGYEPVGFLHATDALSALRATPLRFDAVLIGRLTLDMSALDLASALHEFAQHLPILLATGSTEDVSVEALAAAGISEVVHCPFVSTEILAALSRSLANSKKVSGELQS
jgi:signal transduction histidine kinase/CheY-like chemotaxis protein